MKVLKPKLIIADTNKSKSCFYKYIFFITIFSAGFYLGYITKENSYLEGYITKAQDSISVGKSFNDRIDYIRNYFESYISARQEVNEPTISIPKRSYNYSYSNNMDDSKSSTNIVHSSIRNSTDNSNYTDEKYTLQVAAFETDKKAQEVVTELLKKGYDAYSTISVNSRGNKWHLIRIGIFNSYDEAFEYSEKIFKLDGIISEIEILEPPAITKLSNFDLE